ncbi:hypothetical protein QYE76_001538 [Lolium multiflorum]|uniref:DYW domain-containing protein n=1 Tax=Lolium multiflorum TaxID=4521 RepID=A0AAD8RJZ8_LOLMU|nr:hypothetical protein QYE76_001538 [Lolium multiflorum]
MHKKLELGEAAWARLVELDPRHNGDYVLLSNLYAAVARWADVHVLRKTMITHGVRKNPGHSLVELRNSLYEFVMGDRSHPESEQIYQMLAQIAERLRHQGYVPRTSNVLADIEEEEKEAALNYHSERLAIAFALLKSLPGTPIRIAREDERSNRCVAKLFGVSPILWCTVWGYTPFGIGGDSYNDKDDTPDKEEVEEEPKKHAKNKKYTKEDFIAEKHGAVIDCNKGMVTFNVDDKEHTVYFPKRIDKKRKMKKFKFGELFKKGTTSTGRPSRASTQIRRSYNEDIIAPSFAPEEDNGAPNASSFPCYDFLTNAGILDDFFTLVNRAGLATYVGDEREQYYMLTKIFVESFKFHNTQYEPTVAFKIYGNPVTMELEEFCRALDIAPVGTARRIDDNPGTCWSSIEGSPKMIAAPFSAAR